MNKPKNGSAVGTLNNSDTESPAVQDHPDTTVSQDDPSVADETCGAEGEQGLSPEAGAAHHIDDTARSAHASSQDPESHPDVREHGSAKIKRRINWSRLVAYGLLPGLALLLSVTAALMKWQASSDPVSQGGRIESIAAAKDSTIALLSYQPDTVEKDLHAAQDRLTGDFKNAYTQLTNDVVIPGSREKHISAVATVPAAASVSVTPNHAVTLLFVNQTVVIGTDAPTETASVVRVSLTKVSDRWLVSGFDPI